MHLLLPGEYILTAPARWHYLYRNSKSDDFIERLGLELNRCNPQNLFDNRLFSYQTIISELGWIKGFTKHDFNCYQTAYLLPQDLESWEKDKVLDIFGAHSTHMKHWRWCPKCIIEDEEQFGVPYYHRDHQLPGVFHCQKHCEILNDKCDACGWYVRSLKEQCIPPFNNVCPNCGHSISNPEILTTETIKSIELASLKLANTDYTPKRLNALQYNIRKSVGILSIAENTVEERKRLRDWQYHFFSSFSELELRSWFRKLQPHNGLMISPLMRHSRLTKAKPLSKPLHPLAYLLAEHFLRVSLELESNEEFAA
jgi:hypothetical protein